jgi:hypothetical protein
MRDFRTWDEIADHWHRRLRARCERPCCRAPNKCDELASPHGFLPGEGLNPISRSRIVHQANLSTRLLRWVICRTSPSPKTWPLHAQSRNRWRHFRHLRAARAVAIESRWRTLTCLLISHAYYFTTPRATRRRRTFAHNRRTARCSDCRSSSASTLASAASPIDQGLGHGLGAP